MTINEKFRGFLEQLNGIYEKNEAAHITHLVFQFICHTSKSDIIKQPNLFLDEKTESKLNLALSELLKHRPVQYVIGECEFHKMKIKVNESVLIPRPETEELVELIITDIKKLGSNKIIDIGTGSGCIPIAIKNYLPDIDMEAVDCSEKALELANENALLNHSEISFRKMDFLNEDEWKLLGVYDCIISNPPYIPAREIDLMERNVKEHEPHTALFVPDGNPLLFYEKIFSFSKKHLKEGGRIYLEIHKDFGKEVCGIFNKKEYSTELKKDIFGNDRFVVVTRCL